MQDEPRHWCLCGAPYELLRCVYASSNTLTWYWYCFECGGYESAESEIKKSKEKGNGKEYRGAL